MILEDLQREVGQEKADDLASEFGRSEKVDAVDRSALLTYKIADEGDGEFLDGLGGGKEQNNMMQSQRAEKNKNTEVEIPVETNKS